MKTLILCAALVFGSLAFGQTRMSVGGDEVSVIETGPAITTKSPQKRPRKFIDLACSEHWNMTWMLMNDRSQNVRDAIEWAWTKCPVEDLLRLDPHPTPHLGALRPKSETKRELEARHIKYPAYVLADRIGPTKP